MPNDLARDLRCALDPVVFAAERLQLDLDGWQAALLRDRLRRELLNVHRQGGKSKTTAVGVLHEGAYRCGSKTIVISPSKRQSGLLLAKVEELVGVAKIRTWPHPGDDPGLLLPAGELICLPGGEATTRGFDGCTWLICDEAARATSDDCVWNVPKRDIVAGLVVMLQSCELAAADVAGSEGGKLVGYELDQFAPGCNRARRCRRWCVITAGSSFLLACGGACMGLFSRVVFVRLTSASFSLLFRM